MNWLKISSTPGLTEAFIRKSQTSIYWNWIAMTQILSEDFIREFQDKLDWNDISTYQNLSQEFIIEFFDKLHLDFLLKNEKSNLSDNMKLLIKLQLL